MVEGFASLQYVPPKLKPWNSEQIALPTTESSIKNKIGGTFPQVRMVMRISQSVSTKIKMMELIADGQTPVKVRYLKKKMVELFALSQLPVSYVNEFSTRIKMMELSTNERVDHS